MWYKTKSIMCMFCKNVVSDEIVGDGLKNSK